MCNSTTGYLLSSGSEQHEVLMFGSIEEGILQGCD